MRISKNVEEALKGKINIFGPPGSGKTKLAERLGKALQTKNVYHLDKYFWKPGWVKTTLKERKLILNDLIKQEKWIIEGSFSNVAHHRGTQANVNIHLSVNKLICLSRVIMLYLSSTEKKKREIAPGCPDKLSKKYLLSIWNYSRDEGKDLLNQLKGKNLIILNNQKDIMSLINTLSRID